MPPKMKYTSKKKMLKAHKAELTELEHARNRKIKKCQKGDPGRAERKAVHAEYADNVKEVEARHTLEIEEFDAAAAAAAAGEGENDSEKKDEEQEKKEKAKSRAQRRRERQKARRAEEIAAMELDAANSSSTEDQSDYAKRKEIEALEEMLKPKGFGIQDVRADGHCLFRAAYDQMCRRRGVASADREKDGHWGMRKIATTHMLENRQEFAPFLEIETSFEKYCERMRTSSDWGGQIEIQALAAALGARIEVYRAGLQAPIVMGEIYDGEPLRLSYHENYYTLGEHYNSVVPLADAVPLPLGAKVSDQGATGKEAEWQSIAPVQQQKKSST